MLRDQATARHLTAIARTELSRPFRYALEDGVLTPDLSVMDYGCGRGGDVNRLDAKGYDCAAWDPAHRPDGTRRASDVVNLGYVLNVIESAVERVDVLRSAWSLTRRVLVLAVRSTADLKEEEGLRPHEDGFLTRLGTFQKYFDPKELRDWSEAILGVPSVTAAPGVLYFFRDEVLREAFAASRIRRRATTPGLRISDVIFESKKELLEPLMAFVSDRGRLPVDDELPATNEIVQEFGSLKRAFGLIQRVTGKDPWDRIRDERAQDLLVYVALSRFVRRPRFGALPRDLQHDVRAFFSTYANACSMADLLLFSSGDPTRRDSAFRAATVGKLMPTALYVHASALSLLPAILRIYEGCGGSYLGRMENATVVKLHRDQPRISYLGYPTFDEDAHPVLTFSISVHLQSFAVERRNYRDDSNPPILHRKEEFVPSDYPLRERFARLTTQEEKRGLFASPSSIGTRGAWESLLALKGLRVAGHRLMKGARP